MRIRLALLIAPLLLSACGKDPEPATPRSYHDLSLSLDESRREATRWLGENGERARSAWDHLPNGQAWTATALFEIARLRPALERTQDREDFCPGYDSATDYQRNTCWLRLLSAMARFESNFRPEATYLEASGRTSVGLLMMDPDHCPAADTAEKLKDPALNIRCASNRLRLLVERDGWLSGPGNAGAAAYWSVLRAPYTSNGMLLGRKPHIQLFTRTYRGFRAP